jgi:hypothetical protein
MRTAKVVVVPKIERKSATGATKRYECWVKDKMHVELRAGLDDHHLKLIRHFLMLSHGLLLPPNPYAPA